MAEATFHFPRGFLWGSATSSHQVEGNNTNNQWWAWEQQPGRIHEGQKSGLACDWWGGRWREDLDRAAQAGQNAHRLSIEWSRVQPTPDHWDESAIDHYREIMQGMLERGMMPMVTLHHFSDPLWFVEQGGWEDCPQVVQYFTAYTNKVVEALRNYVNLWVTINEPDVFTANGYILGAFPPGKTDLTAAFSVMSNMVRAHASAYHAIHAQQPEARVGLAHHYRPFTPARRWNPLDRLVTGLQDGVFNRFFAEAAHTGRLRYPLWTRQMPEAKGTQDFLGLNYYTDEIVAFAPTLPGEAFARRYFHPGAELSSTGFIANRPEGFWQALKWANSFGLPIIITENGVEDPGDDLRRRYLIHHIHQLWRAVNFNYPIKGYFHWSLLDNFEWERGWSQRFGLWEVDPESQARRKRPSVDLYAEICHENGLSSDMVRRYSPGLSATLFPD